MVRSTSSSRVSKTEVDFGFHPSAKPRSALVLEFLATELRQTVTAVLQSPKTYLRSGSSLTASWKVMSSVALCAILPFACKISAMRISTFP